MRFDFSSWNRRHTFNGKRFSEILSEDDVEFLVKIKTKKISYGFHAYSTNRNFEIPKLVFEMVKNKYPIHKYEYDKIYA